MIKRTGKGFYLLVALLSVFSGRAAWINGEQAKYMLLARSSIREVVKCGTCTNYTNGTCYRWFIDPPTDCSFWLFALDDNGNCESLIDPSKEKETISMYAMNGYAYPPKQQWFIPETGVRFILIFSTEPLPALEESIVRKDVNAQKKEIRSLIMNTSPYRKSPRTSVPMSGSWRGSDVTIQPDTVDCNGTVTMVYEITY